MTDGVTDGVAQGAAQPFPVLNEPAIRSVVAYIAFEPERWDQGYFSPQGSHGMCLAAIACKLAGYDTGKLMADHGAWAVRDVGQMLLGLTESQADRLFYWTQTPMSVSQLKEEISAVTGMQW